jgi:hypothetical protein
MKNNRTKKTRLKVFAALKKQAMAQQVVSDANNQIDINDPNYTDKIMDLILNGVVDSMIDDVQD